MIIALELEYKAQEGLFFRVTDKQTGDKSLVGIDLRYWSNYLGFG